MKRAKYFFESLIKSVFKPAYYEEITKAPLSSSIKYFVLFIFIVLLFTIFIPLITILPLLPKLSQEVESLYPSSLEIRLENGQITTNQKEPYYLVNERDFVVVIDTTESLKDVPFDKAGILVTKDKIITKQKAGFEERVYNLSQIKEPLTINKSLVSHFIKQLKPAVFLIAIFSLIFLLPFVYIFILIWSFFYILLVNLFPFLLSKLMSLGHSYENLLKISLHAYTLPQILQVLFGNLLKISFPPFSFTLFYLAFTTTILISLKNNKH